MLPGDQPTIPTDQPNGPRPASMGWQASSVEEMQAKLPQYDVIEILGRGGMGAVYKARQKSLKRLVAIKILPLGMADDEFKFVERFQNEARTMAQMNHPAIVSVHDFGETSDGLLYIVMEFVDGTDVHKMIQASGKLSGDYALAITAHVCDALAYAHKRGVIHRDIKPANILIDQEGHIKVADFGLAKMNDPEQTSGLTRTNVAMGSPDYVAPETLKQGAVVDHRADIYAVGVMLYQMLTGEVPRGMFKLPSQKGIGCDPRFDEIIHRTMEQDRDERYQSAMDVRRALDVILTTPQPKDDGTGVVAANDLPQKPAARQPRSPGNADIPVRPPNEPPQRGAGRKTADKSVRATWLSIGGIVAVLAAGGWFVFGGKRPPAASPTVAKSDATTPGAAEQAATTIDWLKAVPPEMRSRTAEWGGFKDGVLTPAAKFSRMLGTLKDGSVRVRVRRTPGSDASINPMLAVEIRNGAIPGKATGFGQYQFQVFVPKRTCSFNFEEKARAGVRGELEYLWRGDPKVADDPGSDGIEWEFRAVGDEFSAWADGKLIQSIRDPRVPAGICTITVDAGMQITRLETTGVTPIKRSATPTQGRVVNLLPLVDVKRDTVSGAWSRVGDGLVLKPDPIASPGVSRLQLPYQPPEEYDFEFEFTPDTDARDLSQVLSASGRSFAWTINAATASGKKSGFEMIDGKMVIDRTEGSVVRQRFLAAGKRHRTKVEVRKSGLKGFCDDQELVACGSAPDSNGQLDIPPNRALRDALHLGIAANPSLGMTVHKLTVREITGAGKVDGGASAAH